MNERLTSVHDFAEVQAARAREADLRQRLEAAGDELAAALAGRDDERFAGLALKSGNAELTKALTSASARVQTAEVLVRSLEAALRLQAAKVDDACDKAAREIAHAAQPDHDKLLEQTLEALGAAQRAVAAYNAHRDTVQRAQDGYARGALVTIKGQLWEMGALLGRFFYFMPTTLSQYTRTTSLVRKIDKWGGRWAG